MSVTLDVLSPVAPDENIAQVAAPETLAQLDGKRIGILNNIKPGAHMLQPYIEKHLKERIPEVQFRAWMVPFSTPQSDKDRLLAEISDFSDGVIALVGD